MFLNAQSTQTCSENVVIRGLIGMSSYAVQIVKEAVIREGDLNKVCERRRET